MTRAQMSEDNLSADSTLSVNPWEDELRQREESDKVEGGERGRGREKKKYEERTRRSQSILPQQRTIAGTNNEHSPEPQKGIALIFASANKHLDLLENQLDDLEAEFLRVQDVVAGVRNTVLNLNKPEAIKLVDADALKNYRRIGDRLRSIAYYIEMISPDHEFSEVDVTRMTDKYLIRRSVVDEASHRTCGSSVSVLVSPENRSTATSIMDRKHRRRRPQVGPDLNMPVPNEFVIPPRQQPWPAASDQDEASDSDLEQPDIDLNTGSRRHQNKSSYIDRMRAPNPQQPRRKHNKRRKEQRNSVDYAREEFKSTRENGTNPRELVDNEKSKLSDYEDYLPKSYSEGVGLRVKARQRSRKGHQLPPPEIQKTLEPRIVLVEPKNQQVSSLEEILQEKQMLLLEMLDDVQTRLEVIHSRQTSKSREDRTEIDGSNSKGNLWNRLKSKVVDRKKTQGETGVET